MKVVRKHYIYECYYSYTSALNWNCCGKNYSKRIWQVMDSRLIHKINAQQPKKEKLHSAALILMWTKIKSIINIRGLPIKSLIYLRKILKIDSKQGKVVHVHRHELQDQGIQEDID